MRFRSHKPLLPLAAITAGVLITFGQVGSFASRSVELPAAASMPEQISLRGSIEPQSAQDGWLMRGFTSPLEPLVTESIQIFAADCTTPKSDFNLGESVCARISGAPLATAPQRQFAWVDACGIVEQGGPIVVSDPQTATFTLPSIDTTAGGACDSRGSWSVADYNVPDDGQQLTAFFNVHDPANRAADLSVIKSAAGGGGFVNAGSNVTFNLLVRNAGPDSAVNVSLVDAVPANTSFISETHPAGWACTDPAVGSTGTLTCTTATLAADPLNLGQPSTFAVTVKINPAAVPGTRISNTVTVSSTTTDPFPGNNSATDASVVVASTTPIGPPIQNQTIIVSPANLQHWQPQTAPGSVPSPASTPTVTFVSGPSTPPLSAGSVQLKVGSDGGATAQVRQPDYAGMALPNSDPSATPAINELSSLSYWTFIQQAGSSDQDPYIILDVNYSGGTTVEDRLVFEPKFQGGGSCPVYPQAPVTGGSWQRWDAFQGCWYSQSGIGGTSPGTVTSLRNISGLKPNALIVNSGVSGGIHVAAGMGGGLVGGLANEWSNFIGNVDDLTIGLYDNADIGSNTTIYDFEPSATVPGAGADVSIVKTGPQGAVANSDVTYSITVTNFGPAAATNLSFVDTLPVPLTFVSFTQTSGPAWNCGAPAATTTCTISSLAANATSTFNFVAHIPNGETVGTQYTNTVNITSDDDRNSENNGSSFTTTVASPPTITKAFGAASIPLNGSTSLSFNLTNPNTNVNLTGIAFTDSLPTGLVVATPNNLASTCSGTIGATANSSTVALSAGTLASGGTCTISVNVRGTTAGIKNNSVFLTSTEGGTGNTSNASVTVVVPPVINKAFGAANIPLGGSTSLTFTIQNNNSATTLTAVGFTDTMPAGLVVSSPNALTGTCGGGTITAVAGSGSVGLSGASIGANGSCTFAVNVTGTSAGVKNNTVSNLTSAEGGTGSPASASLTVIGPPIASKAFGTSPIVFGQNTSLSFTVTNPNAASTLTGIGFTDTLPAGLAVSTPNGLTGSCGGGTITASAGGGSVVLTNASLAANTSCNFSVNVIAIAVGVQNNTTSAISSVEGGTNNTPATASVTVNKAATTTVITNAAALATSTGIGQSFPVTWSTTVDSPGGGTPTGTVTVSDGTDSCSAIVSAGTCTLTSTTAGVKTITATYGGDTNFLSSFGTAQHTVVINISGNIKRYVVDGPNTNLPGVTVTIPGPGGPYVGTTDGSGNYTLGVGVGGGTYVITPSNGAAVFEPLSRTITNVTAAVSNANFLAYDNQAAVPRTLSVVNTIVTPGQIVAVPIVMMSLGNERSVSFSLNYDANPISSTPTASCGTSAPGCTVTFNNSIPGKIGVTVTIPGLFNAGLREVAEVNFQSLPNSLSNTPITFGDAPVARSVKDGNNNPLPFTTADGLIVFAQGIEGDLAGRKTGNGQLEAADVTIERQFVVGTIIPDPAFNEFQRADTAPGVTKGDGQLDATDIIQERRYVAGIDLPQSAGGTGGLPTPVLGPVPLEENRPAASSRTMRVVSVYASAGGKASIAVEMDDQTSTVGASFTLNFDPSKLSNPSVELASDAASDTILTVNANKTANGKLGILVDSGAALAKRVVTVTFDVAANASGGETPLTFTDDLAHRGVADVDGSRLATAYEDGKVTISGAASVGFRVSGRVTTPEGNPLRNATVSITNADGRTRTVKTSSFGFYEFEGVTAGHGYTIAVASRRYRFALRMVSVGSDLADIDLTAQE